MVIGFGNDHGATELKNELMEHVISLGHTVINFGTDGKDSVNYPDYAKKVGQAVVSGECDLGILLCGTGIGMSMAANKIKGIRAALCSEPYSAKLTKEHNNANVLCLGARVIGPELAKMTVEAWLNAEFQGGRHAERIAMIE